MKRNAVRTDLLLDGEPEDGDDAVHRLVFPPHGAAAVR